MLNLEFSRACRVDTNWEKSPVFYNEGYIPVLFGYMVGEWPALLGYLRTYFRMNMSTNI